MEIGEMETAAKTLRESFSTTAERIQDINESIKKGNLTTAQLQDADRELAMLKMQQTREAGEESMRALSQISYLTQKGFSVEEAEKRVSGELGKKVTAKESLDKVLSSLEQAKPTGPGAEEMQKNIQKTVAEMRERMAKGENLAGISGDLGAFIDKFQLWERMYQLDKTTFFKEDQERAERKLFDAEVRKALWHITQWAPPQAHLANLAVGSLVSLGNIIQFLASILGAIGGIKILIDFIRSKMYGGGARRSRALQVLQALQEVREVRAEKAAAKAAGRDFGVKDVRCRV
jgi:hypothetical protein